MSRPPFAQNLISKLKINTSFTATRHTGLKRLAAGGSSIRRASAFLALFAIITAVFYNGSTVTASSAHGDAGSAPARLQFVAPQTTALGSTNAPSPLLLSPALFQLSLTEELTTYEATCQTEKTDFNLGDTICVRATYPAIFFFRRITLVDPDNHILGSALLTSSGDTHVFTIPPTATSVIGGNTVDNRGTWRIDLRTADGSRSASHAFDVHEPANPRADLQISIGGDNREVESPASVSVKVVVYNAGPDAATDVEVSAPSMAGLSLDSLTPAAGGTCPAGVCAVASLPARGIALFIASYDVTAAPGARVQAVATVAGETEDPRPSNNSDKSTFTVTQASTGTETCALTAPQPITVNGSLIPDPNDPDETLYGAVVNYSVAAEGAGCAPVQCDTPSGSTFPTGTTIVSCTAASGDSVSFPVTVVDTRSFSITLNGANPLVVECNGTPPFADPGATTNRPGVTPTASSNVNPSKPGTYTITYTATDGANTVTATRTVNVVDDAPPQIILNGDNAQTDEVETQEITIECHAAFTDPGATANDACRGTVPVSVNSNVDPNKVGTYTITYSATDDQGTPADSSDDLTATETRTVHVVDTTAPVITLTGGNTLTVECHSAFTDPGATATDACEGDLNSAVQVSGTVDPNTVGSYTLNYTVTDAHGNQATATRTVNVVDTTAPVITVKGASPAVVECHTSYTDEGATANDACDGVVPVNTTGSVDVDTPGTYTITYTATDGTNTRTATRTVTVVDTIAPVISCPANIVVVLDANTPAVSRPVSFDAPTATDSCGAATVTTSHQSGAYFPVGTTLVTATATDPSNNSSSCPFTVSVHYRFAGFFSPISNLPVVNTVKAGSAIPIKFSLSGNKGLNIFAADSPASGVIPCSSSDPAVDLTQIDTTGASVLTYDAGSDQYHYNWKTQKGWEGTCRQLVVKLNDGTEHRANFKFK